MGQKNSALAEAYDRINGTSSKGLSNDEIAKNVLEQAAALADDERGNILNEIQNILEFSSNEARGELIEWAEMALTLHA